MKTKKVYPPKKIWAKFRRQRLKLEMTQEQLAEKLDISQSHIQRHENGHHQVVEWSFLRKYARALGLWIEIEPAKINVITDDEHKARVDELIKIEEANLPEEIV